MMYILKAEISYNKILFLGFLSFVPFICFIESLFVDVPHYLILIPMFLFVQNWIILRNRDNRDLQNVRLTVSMMTVAIARILMVIISCLSVMIFYQIAHIIFVNLSPANHDMNYLSLITFGGVILCGCSIYFILRDLLLVFFRNNRFVKINKERSKSALMIIALLFNLLGIYAFIARPEIIGNIFEFIIIHYPFSNVFNVTILILVSLVLACLSTLSFLSRKSYIE